ncbi:hypothetical protein GLOIN_2v1772840 [Rhizophagus irregularis DAOM 181602=DAOM 197198]|uniref:Uncharacterized protein n=2 Tax=Rhizophagus irregularis TaxID=588596 RepID=U9U414_RHIID|nr:hypothetical protein GLOIN_2v1772840 [Rhizophagus irregularis DAOM 181602=DAOM 197198]POG73224.1 hypothetical protein GLOIN_2v1772840 [Rhizophagus irregularis DAOM 181602=DAOM 197198]GBC14775.2 hypothetical protein GLOIN_2v1772840 [Rhizophagus irregularis DAOM 181602=DAOM 197198]|eukprot:XP_025180090.1 hypothetical protein GLOIN_2v1772840 [Rhizophagus irregularis DAOM 181602=DAOM 197198]
MNFLNWDKYYEQNDEKNEPHYRATLVYSYPSELDNVESEKVKEMLLMLCPILGLGANNAIQDDKLSQALLKYTDDNISFIKEYEKEMLKRTSADVLKSRNVTLRLPHHLDL